MGLSQAPPKGMKNGFHRSFCSPSNRIVIPRACDFFDLFVFFCTRNS
jgi:hypothetical protein